MWTCTCLRFEQLEHVKSIFLCAIIHVVHFSSLLMAKWIAFYFVTFYLPGKVLGEIQPVQNNLCMHLWNKVSVFCVSAHLLLDITAMAAMNGTPFPVHAASQLLTNLNSSSTSRQAEAIRGVQITATLLIFLVRNPPWLHCMYCRFGNSDFRSSVLQESVSLSFLHFVFCS